MRDNKQQGSSKPQSPQKGYANDGQVRKSNDRTTTTNSKPSPGHKK